jgi:hypothetical protein
MGWQRWLRSTSDYFLLSPYLAHGAELAEPLWNIHVEGVTKWGQLADHLLVFTG